MGAADFVSFDPTAFRGLPSSTTVPRDGLFDTTSAPVLFDHASRNRDRLSRQLNASQKISTSKGKAGNLPSPWLGVGDFEFQALARCNLRAAIALPSHGHAGRRHQYAAKRPVPGRLPTQALRRRAGRSSTRTAGKSGGKPAFAIPGLSIQVWRHGLRTADPEQRLARLGASAKLLDVAFRPPPAPTSARASTGSWLIPVVGDVGDFAVAGARGARARRAVAYRRRMLANVAVDGVVGIVPLAGDAFDVMLRAVERAVAGGWRSSLEHDPER